MRQFSAVKNLGCYANKAIKSSNIYKDKDAQAKRKLKANIGSSARSNRNKKITLPSFKTGE